MRARPKPRRTRGPSGPVHRSSSLREGVEQKAQRGRDHHEVAAAADPHGEDAARLHGGGPVGHTAAHYAPERTVSPGEFLDKQTILEIKLARIENPAALENVRAELGPAAPRVGRLAVRRAPTCRAGRRAAQGERDLWEIEDRIRLKEKDQDFDAEFVELARGVYRTNDRRSAIKRAINVALASDLLEEKSYKG
jgi:hypothetical protein